MTVNLLSVVTLQQTLQLLSGLTSSLLNAKLLQLYWVTPLPLFKFSADTSTTWLLFNIHLSCFYLTQSDPPSLSSAPDAILHLSTRCPQTLQPAPVAWLRYLLTCSSFSNHLWVFTPAPFSSVSSQIVSVASCLFFPASETWILYLQPKPYTFICTCLPVSPLTFPPPVQLWILSLFY